MRGDNDDDGDAVVQVRCPNCDKRLFDVTRDSNGIISIKCERCGTVMAVKLHRVNYRSTK